MIRLSKAEARLSLLNAEDHEVVRHLSLCRGSLTVSDLAKSLGMSRSGAVHRLYETSLNSVFKRLKPHTSMRFPEIFFASKKYGRIFNPDYVEPRTLHTLLDGLLRTRIPIRDSKSVWSHHVRRPTLLVSESHLDVVDCLDRTESSVIKFLINL